MAPSGPGEAEADPHPASSGTAPTTATASALVTRAPLAPLPYPVLVPLRAAMRISPLPMVLTMVPLR
ncbi:hypothetical protein GCM10027091_75470 [Streptomyces daliensis]